MAKAMYDPWSKIVTKNGYAGYGSLNNYRYLHDHNIGNYVKYFSWEGNISGRNPSQYVLINETAIRCLNGNIGHIVKLDNRHPKKIKFNIL